jgi:hypothetical protein
MINEEKIAQMSMDEIDQVEEEMISISQARPLYERLEQEKRKRLAAISPNKQQQQSSQEQGNESKPAPDGTKAMDFGVSVGSD